MVLHGCGGWREQPISHTPHQPLPTFHFLPFRDMHALAVWVAYNTETFHLHARPIKLDALRLVIKGIDPLNLYELQFVPAARPVRGLRKAGTSARVCACCFAVVKERGKGFYSSSSELLTSREEALWQEEQGREGLQRRWWLHANLHFWVLLQGTVEALLFVKTKDMQPAGLQFICVLLPISLCEKFSFYKGFLAGFLKLTVWLNIIARKKCLKISALVECNNNNNDRSDGLLI